MAARICHAGSCEVDPLGGGYPSADADLRLWVTRDEGQTWEDWGQLLPNTWIAEVTDHDVLVQTYNIWHTRADWTGLSDEAWKKMLARLAPLGLDERESWEEHFRWVQSGEVHAPPPPAVGGVDWWLVGARPDGTVAWSAVAQSDYLLAIADTEGAIVHVYGAPSPLDGSFIANGSLVRAVSLPYSAEVVAMELVDLASASIHEVQGLALPLGSDPASGGQQREFYQFITARPAPAAQ